MKYAIISSAPGGDAQCHKLVESDEAAAKYLEELLASGASEQELKLCSLQEVPFQVEHVPTVTVGETETSGTAQDQSATVFEGFGPSQPHSFVEMDSHAGEDEEPADEELPPAQTIDGEPIGEAEVFTFEA